MEAVSANAGWPKTAPNDELLSAFDPFESSPPDPTSVEEETCDVDDDVADDVEADVADWTIVTAPACDPGDAQTHAPVRTSHAATPPPLVPPTARSPDRFPAASDPPEAVNPNAVRPTVGL